MELEDYKIFERLYELNQSERDYWKNAMEEAFKEEEITPNYSQIRAELGKAVGFYLKLNNYNFEKVYDLNLNYQEYRYRIVLNNDGRVCYKKYRAKIKNPIQFYKEEGGEEIYELVPGLKKLVDELNRMQEKYRVGQEYREEIKIKPCTKMKWIKIELTCPYGYELTLYDGKGVSGELFNLDYSNPEAIENIIKPSIAAVLKHKEKIRKNIAQAKKDALKLIENHPKLNEAYQAMLLCTGI